MSDTEKKPDPLRGALFLANLVAEGEARRIEALSDEEFLAEQKQSGRDPSRVPTTEELLARVKARAARQEADAGRPPRASDVVDDPAPRSRVLPIRRSSRLVWILAAAAVVLLILAALNKPAIVARFHPDGDNGPLPPTLAARPGGEAARRRDRQLPARRVGHLQGHARPRRADRSGGGDGGARPEGTRRDRGVHGARAAEAGQAATLRRAVTPSAAASAA